LRRFGVCSIFDDAVQMAALKFGAQCAESDMRGWHFLMQCEPTLIADCGLWI